VTAGAWRASGGGEVVRRKVSWELRSSWALSLSGQEESRTVCVPEQLRHLGGEKGQQEAMGLKWPPFGHLRFSHLCWDWVWVTE
jgi:hypothetical protein